MREKAGPRPRALLQRVPRGLARLRPRPRRLPDPRWEGVRREKREAAQWLRQQACHPGQSVRSDLQKYSL